MSALRAPPIADPVRLTAAELEWMMGLVESGDVHAFYVWGKWLRERAHVLRCDNNECQRCKARGRYRAARLVHHEVPLRQAPALALSMWRQEGGVWVRQLSSLCDDCHDAEHPERLRRYTAPPLTEERWD